VVFLCREKEVYMGMKTDKVGVGCYTGAGGKVKKNEAGQMLETFEECASREVFEEIGVIVMARNLEKVAIITFTNQGKTPAETSVFEVHFFITHKWVGDPIDSTEMRDGRWLNVSDLMSKDTAPVPLMAADYLFLPLIFSGQKIIGQCTYAPGGQHEVEKWSYLQADCLD
ncbi:MAG: NUDIX domain-containing protein, partial [Patescibacteria group bacterium]